MALLYPGVVFAIFFTLNMLVWGQKSSGAVPFGTLFALFFLWFGISTPLVFVGSYFGYKKPAPEDPVRTNKIPRQIPDQVRCLGHCVLVSPLQIFLIAFGILPSFLTCLMWGFLFCVSHALNLVEEPY